MDEKLVSIIMPVYNAERFLHQAIQSILDQTYRNFELIIIDDGSTDSSSKIIKSFSDDRIRSFFFENQGVSKTRNVGISVSRGEYIALMDADDISEPTRIEKQFNYLMDNPKINILGTNCAVIDELGKKRSFNIYPQNHCDIEFVAPILSPMCFPTMMTYKECLIKIGGYQDNLLVAGDHDLILRLLNKKLNIANFNEYLYQHRICKSSLSFSKNELQKLNHYNSSLIYLDGLLKLGNNSFYDYRRGLLEYYYGNLQIARKFIYKSLKNNTGPKFRLIRLFINSLLSQKLIIYLRRKNILTLINLIVKKIFNYDLQKVKIPKLT